MAVDFLILAVPETSDSHSSENIYCSGLKFSVMWQCVNGRIISITSKHHSQRIFPLPDPESEGIMIL